MGWGVGWGMGWRGEGETRLERSKVGVEVRWGGREVGWIRVGWGVEGS